MQSRQLSWSLRRATEEPGANAAVVFATHSPIFVDPLRFDQVRRLSRPRTAENTTRASRVLKSTTASVADRARDYLPHPDRIQVQLNSLLTEPFAEGFFSEGVVLVEGETDKAVLEEAATDAGPLFRFGVSVVSVAGKSNLVLAHAILSDLGIPAMIVFDSDKGNAERLRLEGKAEAEADSEERKAKRENRSLQRYLRIADAQDFPAGRLGDRLYAWDDNLEEVLGGWQVWHQALESLRTELRDSRLKRPSTYRLATRRCAGQSCEPLQQVLGMARSLTRL